MPLEGDHANDVGLETADGLVCKFDTKDGKIKSPEEIFEGGITFFTETVTNGDRDLAARLTRKNMNSLPYWQARPFTGLEGTEATEEEFNTAMAKL